MAALTDLQIIGPMSTRDVADRLGVSVERVRQLALAGQLRASATSGGWLTFRRADVERLARKRRKAMARKRPR